MKVPELPHTTLGGLQPLPTIRARLLHLPEDETHTVCKQVIAPWVRQPVYGKLQAAGWTELPWLVQGYIQDFFR